MDTIEDAIEACGPYIGQSGTCGDPVASLEGVNEARRLLWNKTQFNTITEYINICCAPECFFLPSAYKQIILGWLGGAPMSLQEEWYQSVPGVGLSPKNSCHRLMVNVGGFHVTFRNYEEAPFQIAIQLESDEDVGTKFTLFAGDPYGTKKKETITGKATPVFAKTKNVYKSVLAIIKPKTKGRVRLYAYDPNNGNFLLLAVYQPYDTNPSFQKYAIGGRGRNGLWNQTFNRATDQRLTLFVKKKFYKLEGENELVEFPIEALTFACKANTYKLASDNSGFSENLSLAVAELNRETADLEIPTATPIKLPHNQVVENLI